MKSRLRGEAKMRREAHPESERIAKSGRIAEKLFSLPEFKKAKTILFYASTKHEVHTHEMIVRALLQGKRVAVPLTDMKCHCLHLSEVKSLGDLAAGRFGILEPTKETFRPVQPGEVDLVIVPGIAFDSHGNRIGYGMGFYDSLLRQMRHAKAIALAFEFQVVDEIPAEAHDVRVHHVVTEERVIECR